jgi:SAM-dependent methyltransferase
MLPATASLRRQALAARPEYAHYHVEEQEARVESLIAMVPGHRASLLDVGARDGFLSSIFVGHFPLTLALDLHRPPALPGVHRIRGDATHLPLPDASIDVVFCAEVLEHIVDLQSACRELMRVARHEVVVGVPYRQAGYARRPHDLPALRRP